MKLQDRIWSKKVDRLQSRDSMASELKWIEGISIGSVIEGKIQEIKDVGVVVSFEKYGDVFGFITRYQLGGTTVATGSLVQAVVLDVAVAERLVDLSLKPEFFGESRGRSLKNQSHKKRRKEPSMDLEMHQTVTAIVEIVKENYLVLSVPECDHAVGYASLSDYNSQKFPQKQFLNGQSVIATVIARPSPSTFGRLLLFLNKMSQASEASSSKRARKKSSFKVGSLGHAEVDEQRHRISLGMKDSYMGDTIDLQLPSQQEPDESIRDNDFTELLTFPGGSLLGDQNMDTEGENGDCPILAQAQLRASIPPLDISLDDIDPNMDKLVGQDQGNIDEAGTVNERNKKKANKKAKKEREQEIRAAEERLVKNDIPRTADEFEKVVRSSPNSSFVWIKYMAFMLSMADAKKARFIAERALNTINFREENEKFNIWVAYINLENKYGNPPQEAVMKVFQRALQYNDPEKVYLALLGMYERTEQHKLADELLDKMIKKFKHSCQVWLRRVQRTLKQQQDEVQPVVSRALLSLPRKEHIDFIKQTAILEFKCGVPDRGRSMFEKILRESPKRTDLWSVYLDQEIRLGDVDMIRQLFERAISLNLKNGNMNFLFNKFLKYENSKGDEERIEYVKRQAMEYIRQSNLA
ncbi:hypothetical protein CIPAW_08G134600 [Carya illinoinensis]|uniref:S1 motif domain-containing protein n=2 Tax=Carya illinoinensis TaxID=32201 RepID=A0A8T1PMF9_CARIL|nr:hypothetical protein CIPAW_08G134600 [Carya illinoinensis]